MNGRDEAAKLIDFFRLNGHPRRGTIGAVLYALLIVLLIQNPFELYLIYHQAYKAVYGASFLLSFALMLVIGAPAGGRLLSTPQLRAYALYAILSLICVFLTAIAISDLNIISSLQFIGRVIQFYLLYWLVEQLGVDRVLEWLYRLSVLLGVLAIIYMTMNILGMTNPFPDIPVAAENGDFYFQVPFGFSQFAIPRNPLAFRVQSYFTESANFAFYQCLFFFYAAYVHRHVKTRTSLACTIIILVSIFTSVSTAGFVTLVAVSLMIGIRVALSGGTRRAVLSLTAMVGIAIAVAIALAAWVATATPEDVVLYRRILSVENRLLEWGVAIDQILASPMGVGLGTEGRIVKVQYALADIVGTYRGANNLLVNVFYLGLPYVFPLVLYLGGLTYWCMRPGAWRTYKLNMLSAMVLVGVVFSFSYDESLTAVFQIVVAALFLEYSKTRRPVRASHD